MSKSLIGFMNEMSESTPLLRVGARMVYRGVGVKAVYGGGGEEGGEVHGTCKQN